MRAEYEAGVIYSFKNITYQQLQAYAVDGSTTLAIHRSIDNLISSRVAAFLGNVGIGRPSFVDYADEISDGVFSQRLVEAEADLVHTFISEIPSYTLSILYDQFLFDSEYRNTILAQLRKRGFAVFTPAKDASLVEVPEIGWGSSFLPRGEREQDLKRYCSRVAQLTQDQRIAYLAVNAALAARQSEAANLGARGT